MRGAYQDKIVDVPLKEHMKRSITPASIVLDDIRSPDGQASVSGMSEDFDNCVNEENIKGFMGKTNTRGK